MTFSSSRLERYGAFIDQEYAAGLLKPQEYSLTDLSSEITERIVQRSFKRIVFTGMGCSAIVSDLIRGFLIECRVPIDVFVLNDYDARFLLPREIIDDEATLVVISSYSGHSVEPMLALEKMHTIRHRVLLLTSGGRLAEQGQALGVSIVYWRLGKPDREYPLFHVTQYFAILLDVLARLGVLTSNHQDDLANLAAELRSGAGARAVQARLIAKRSRDANIVMIASPRWHETLLKLCKMHLNEIAMVPATRNYVHEFCHSEVASLSDPQRRHSLLVFVDCEDDAYTRDKSENLIGLLTAGRPENRALSVTRVDLDQPCFLSRLFTSLDLIQRVTLELGQYTNTPSRELISEAAGNPWYHTSTIERERATAVA